ncbi:MAG TPA: YceI family protein [Bacteroidota bacterium]|nr:YceI family protein [Bacteroidota bacterium]
MKPYVLCLILVGVTGTAAQVTHLKQQKEGSLMTYKLVHPLHHVEATSKEVVYDVQADATKKEIRSVSGWVDVTTFDSGNSNRDSHAMEVIDAISYPEAKFESADVLQRGDSLIVKGKLTFHGVTKDVLALCKASWSEGKLEVDGGFDVSLTAFNIDRPSLLMIPVEDRLSFSLVALFVLN